MVYSSGSHGAVWESILLKELQQILLGFKKKVDFVSSVKVAIIGCGYWGQNLVRNFFEVDGAELTIACDTDEKALARVQKRFPTVRLSRSVEEVLADPE